MNSDTCQRSTGRFSNWIYRLRAIWLALIAALVEHDHWSTFLFRHFVRWYAPFESNGPAHHQDTRYLPHGLARADAAALAQALARQPAVQRAFLVRAKAASRSGDIVLGERQLLLGIQPRSDSSGASFIDPLIADLTLAESLVVVVLEGRYRKLGRALSQVPDSLLLQ